MHQIKGGIVRRGKVFLIRMHKFGGLSLREAKQGEAETLDNFHTRLRSMAEACEFADETFEMEEQLII